MVRTRSDYRKPHVVPLFGMTASNTVIGQRRREQILAFMQQYLAEAGRATDV